MTNSEPPGHLPSVFHHSYIYAIVELKTSQMVEQRKAKLKLLIIRN